MPDRSRPITVLVADDEEAIRRALRDLLSGDGSVRVVGSAADAGEAIRQAARLRPDVAVVDVRMPGGGPAAASGIRRSSPQTRVLALSAYDDRSTILKMLRAGAVGYLVKGEPAGTIMEAIHMAVNGEAALSTRVGATVIHELVTSLERAERLAEELDHLNRVKSDVIQIISHELMNPITVIRGVAGLLRDGGPDIPREQLVDLNEGIDRAAHRLRRMVGDLAVVAQLDGEEVELETEPFPVTELVTRATAEFASSAGRLRPPALEERRLRVWADPGLAVRALAAVLENALALSPTDTPVDVQVIARPSHVQLRVLDRGPGIPPGYRARLFDAFSQADASPTRAHEGVGIGLYLARAIMRAHEGSIRFDAREEGGSAFTLEFPAAPDES